jgi:hypothetical protein
LKRIYAWDKGNCLADNPPPCISLEQITQAEQAEQEVFGA